MSLIVDILNPILNKDCFNLIINYYSFESLLRSYWEGITKKETKEILLKISRGSDEITHFRCKNLMDGILKFEKLLKLNFINTSDGKCGNGVIDEDGIRRTKERKIIEPRPHYYFDRNIYEDFNLYNNIQFDYLYDIILSEEINKEKEELTLDEIEDYDDYDVDRDFDEKEFSIPRKEDEEDEKYIRYNFEDIPKMYQEKYVVFNKFYNLNVMDKITKSFLNCYYGDFVIEVSDPIKKITSSTEFSLEQKKFINDIEYMIEQEQDKADIKNKYSIIKGSISKKMSEIEKEFRILNEEISKSLDSENIDKNEYINQYGL